MLNDISTGSTERQSRPGEGGDVVLVERMRRADIGPKSIMVEQYGTWLREGAGPALVRTFNTLPEADQDFATR